MPFRVYAPKGRIENSQYALDIGAKILQMYEGMFDLLFPLPKSGKHLNSEIYVCGIELLNY